MRVITGSAKGRLLKPPRNRKIRPTADKVKNAFFNMVGNAVRGGSFLDLFAGTGSMGIEALSRGVARCVFVDKGKDSLRLIKENLYRTGFQKGADVLNCDFTRALKVLKKNGELFDIIYIDPPYHLYRIDVILSIINDYRLLVSGGFIGVERDRRENFAWLEGAPFQLKQQKVYGDTRLIFLSTGAC
ncbi:MAG TPA: 16S rRNA (guanine(966)-N(2))-methyltransferase RsmD [Firmicutes bacterium]|nr:16S rRNA (guanine(966)-N(2))-methyltransferase RsmD [Bacillota bacterium]